MNKRERVLLCGGLFALYFIVVCALGAGIALLLNGCATITPASTGASVCDSVPEVQISAICTLAGKMGVTPEEISKGIQVANLAGLMKPYYTALEAKEFLTLIRKNIKAAKQSGATITLDQVFDYANAKYKLLTPQAQAAINIINPVNLKAYGIKLDLIDYDFDLLLQGIDEQMEVVEPFL